eukprot:ctg_562.g266
MPISPPTNVGEKIFRNARPRTPTPADHGRAGPHGTARVQHRHAVHRLVSARRTPVRLTRRLHTGRMGPAHISVGRERHPLHQPAAQPAVLAIRPTDREQRTGRAASNPIGQSAPTRRARSGGTCVAVHRALPACGTGAELPGVRFLPHGDYGRVLRGRLWRDRHLGGIRRVSAGATGSTGAGRAVGGGGDESGSQGGSAAVLSGVFGGGARGLHHHQFGSTGFRSARAVVSV